MAVWRTKTIVMERLYLAGNAEARISGRRRSPEKARFWYVKSVARPRHRCGMTMKAIAYKAFCIMRFGLLAMRLDGAGLYPKMSR